MPPPVSDRRTNNLPPGNDVALTIAGSVFRQPNKSVSTSQSSVNLETAESTYRSHEQPRRISPATPPKRLSPPAPPKPRQAPPIPASKENIREMGAPPPIPPSRGPPPAVPTSREHPPSIPPSKIERKNTNSGARPPPPIHNQPILSFTPSTPTIQTISDNSDPRWSFRADIPIPRSFPSGELQVERRYSSAKPAPPGIVF